MPSVRVYIRMSTERQANSPHAQKLEIDNWLSSKQDSPTDRQYYADTAVVGDRPFTKRLEGIRLLQDLKKGDWVVVTKVDRLGRNTRDILNTIHAIDECGGRLFILDFMGMEFDMANSMHQAVLIMGAWFAQYDNQMRSERVLSTNRWLKSQARAYNGQPPFGKKLVKKIGTDPATGKQKEYKYWEDSPDEQKVINLATELWNKGLSATRVAKELNKRGYKNRAGNLFRAKWVEKFVAKMKLSRAKARQLAEVEYDTRMLHNQRIL